MHDVSALSGERIRILPQPGGVFRLLDAQNLSWPTAIAELVDNSFDAKATRVELRFNPGKDKSWQCCDDGVGCSDLSRMLHLGGHYGHRASKQPLGTYGVGLKDAWAFSGGNLHITSTHAEKTGTLDLNLNTDIDEEWYIPAPSYSLADGQPNGTCIRFGLRAGRSLPKKNTWDKLSWIFSPALSQGRQIVVYAPHKQALTPAQLPPFAKFVSTAFDVSGKEVSIEIGIVKDGHKMPEGPFWLVYGHRIIRPTTHGCGGYDTLRMGGRIVLGSGWMLTKNKDDLNRHSEELSAAIFERIEPLLKEHSTMAEQVELAALKTEVEAMLNSQHAGDGTKAKRRPRSNDSGTVEPKGTGAPHKNYERSQPASGDIRKRGGFSINFYETDENTIGRFEEGTGVVSLNLSHSFVSAAKSRGDRFSLYAIAVAILSNRLCQLDPKGRPYLRGFEPQEFAGTFSHLLNGVVKQAETSGNGH